MNGVVDKDAALFAEQNPDASLPFRDEVWTTKDGRRINVGDMEEAHVRDALRMVIRRARKGARKRQLKRTLAVIAKSAQDDIDNDRKWGSQ